MNAALKIQAVAGGGGASPDQANADLATVLSSTRLERERRTIAAMLQCYCQDHHETKGGLCAECQELLDYATQRLARCRYGAEKPTCVNCPVHCYQPKRREQVKAVMRYAGPRMLWRHPVLSVRHLLDGRRPAPW